MTTAAIWLLCAALAVMAVLLCYGCRGWRDRD